MVTSSICTAGEYCLLICLTDYPPLIFLHPILPYALPTPLNSPSQESLSGVKDAASKLAPDFMKVKAKPEPEKTTKEDPPEKAFDLVSESLDATDDTSGELAVDEASALQRDRARETSPAKRVAFSDTTRGGAGFPAAGAPPPGESLDVNMEGQPPRGARGREIYFPFSAARRRPGFQAGERTRCTRRRALAASKRIKQTRYCEQEQEHRDVNTGQPRVRRRDAHRPSGV